MPRFTRYLLFALVLPGSLFAQMNGTYTVGGSPSDFFNMDQAAAALHSQGVSGPVTILLKNGSYPGFTLESIPNSSAEKPVIFESQSGDSSKVLFQGHTLLNNLQFVTFRSLGFHNPGSGSLGTLLEVKVCHQLLFDRCDIRDNGNASYTSDDGLILFSFDYSGAKKTVNIANSNLSTADKAVVVRGAQGYLHIQYTRVRGGYDFWIAGPVDMDHCQVSIPASLAGDINNFFGSYTWNDLDCDASAVVSVASSKFWHNTVHCPIDLSQAGNILYNEFLGPMQMFPHLASGAAYNTFYQGATFAYVTPMHLSSNKFHGTVYVSFCDGSLLSSNFFFDSLIITHGGDYEVIQNSFAKGAYFEMDYTSGSVKYNLLDRCSLVNLQITAIEKNNYFPATSGTYPAYFDTDPLFYDPGYADNATDLHATNPLLAGRGTLLGTVWYYNKDIDTQLRPYHTSLGANEICLQRPLPDTIGVWCKDSVWLNQCPVVPGSHWVPVSILTHADSPRPVAYPTEPFTVMYLLDSLGQVIDSTVIRVNPFTSRPPRHYYGYCGWPVQIGTLRPPGAAVTWAPAYGLDDPHSFTPGIVHPTDSVYYMAHVTVPGCTDYFDTVFLNINPMPLAYWEATEINPCEISFYNESLCTDGQTWFFGDNTSSSEFNPIHTYPGAGNYPVTLAVYNSAGVDTSRFYVYASCVSGTGEPVSPPAIAVKPVPATSYLDIDLAAPGAWETSVTIRDLYGRIRYAGLLPGGQHVRVDVHFLPSGMYVLEAGNDGKWFEVRFIKAD